MKRTIVIGVVLLIASLLIAPSILAHEGSDIKLSDLIAAYSCDADFVCDVNNLRVLDKSVFYDKVTMENLLEVVAIVVSEDLSISNEEGDATLTADNIVAKDIVTTNLYVDSTSEFDNNVEFGDYVLFNGDDNVQFLGLSGEGDAYACFDSGGIIFRSEVPCA